MKEIIVEQKNDGKKLNTFLLKTFPNLSQNTLQKALRKKDIKVNDLRVSENIILHAGDKLKVFICDDLLTGNNKINLDIIYEDTNIIIVNKPANIEVVGENSLTTNLENYIKAILSPAIGLIEILPGLFYLLKMKNLYPFYLINSNHKKLKNII